MAEQFPIPETAGFQVAYRFSINGLQSAECVFAVRAPDEDTDETAVAGEAEAAAATLSAQFSEDLVSNSVTVQRILNGSPLFTFPWDQAFTGDSPITPGQACMVVTKLTAFGGRSGRGRFYWPGQPQSQVDTADASKWLTAWFLAWNTAMGDWFSFWTNDGYQPGVYSRLEGLHDIIINLPKQAIGTQRRRLNGGNLW